MVRDTRVRVDAATVADVALVLGIRDLARVGEARGVPHVADRVVSDPCRRVEGRRVLGHEPLEVVLRRRGSALVLQAHVNRSRAQSALDQVTVRVRDTDRRDRDRRVAAAEPERGPAVVVGHDDTDRAGELGVLHLDRERADTAVDETRSCRSSAARRKCGACVRWSTGRPHRRSRERRHPSCRCQSSARTERRGARGALFGDRGRRVDQQDRDRRRVRRAGVTRLRLCRRVARRCR